MIKQLFNYRSKTGEKTPKQSQGRIVRGKALKRNTGRNRGGTIPYQGKQGIQTGEKHPAPVNTIAA